MSTNCSSRCNYCTLQTNFHTTQIDAKCEEANPHARISWVLWEAPGAGAQLGDTPPLDQRPTTFPSGEGGMGEGGLRAAGRERERRQSSGQPRSQSSGEGHIEGCVTWMLLLLLEQAPLEVDHVPG